MNAITVVNGGMQAPKQMIHFGSMNARILGNQREDPNDVFFHARDRKQEIKEQMKELQKGLDRQKPKAKKKKRR